MDSSYFSLVFLVLMFVLSSASASETEKCTTPVDIGFVVDASGSISAKNYQLQKDFIKKVMRANQLSREGAHAGVVLFSQTSSTAIKLNEYYNLTQFDEGVQALKHESSITRIDRGMKTAYDELFTLGYGSRYNVPRLLFLLTDGQQTRSGDFIEPTVAVMPLREIGIKILVIGISSAVDKDELEQIAGDKKNVHIVKGFKQLLDFEFLETFDYACHPERLAASPPSEIKQPTEVPKTIPPPENVPLVDYYIALDITNNDVKNVTFKYEEYGAKKGFVVSPNSKYTYETKISSRTYPLPYTFRAYATKTGEVVQLRDRDQLFVIPRTERIFEKIVLEPQVNESFINLDLTNGMAEAITLRWQQDGNRKSVNLPVKGKISKEIVFDRRKGISPVDFTGRTVKKNFPVKLNGKLEVKILPSTKRKTVQMVATKAVQDFYIVFDVINQATGDIVVEWSENGGGNVAVKHKETESKRLEFKDRLRAPYILARGKLLDSKQRVTLNSRSSFFMRARPSQSKRKVTAGKKYYIDLTARNNVAEDIIVSWMQNGVAESLNVKKGLANSKDLVFTGPEADQNVRFSARTAISKQLVKLNGQDFVDVTPTATKKDSELIATKEYYLDVDIVNRVTDDIVVEWLSASGKQSLEVKEGGKRRQAITRVGVDASEPIEFSAVSKKNNEVVQLNGKESVSFSATASNVAQQVVATKDYFLNVEFKNQVSDDIVVNWNHNGEDKSFEIKQGDTYKQDVVIDSKDVKDRIEFTANIKGTNEVVQLNGEEIASFSATASKAVQQVVATKDYFLNVEIKNQVAYDIEVSWMENGQRKSVNVEKDGSLKERIIADSRNAKDAIVFNAKIKGIIETVKLNGKDSVSFLASTSKAMKQVVATKDYFLNVEFKNEVADDIIVNWNHNGQDKSFEIKQGDVYKHNVVMDSKVAKDPVEFIAKAKGTNEVVMLNKKDSVAFKPTFSEVVKQVVATKDYFLNVEFKNKAGDDIIVNWNHNGEDKSFEIKQGDAYKQDIVIDSKDAKNSIDFSAVAKSTSKPANIDGKTSISFKPSSSKYARQVVVTAPAMVSFKAVNKLDEDIVIAWEENSVPQSLVVPRKSEVNRDINVGESEIDGRIQLIAYKRESKEPVKLNNSESVELSATAIKTQQIVVADGSHLYTLELVNKASGDASIRVQLGGVSNEVKVPYEGVKKSSVKIDKAAALKLSGVNVENKRPVQLNGFLSLPVKVDASKSEDKVIRVVIKDKLCGSKVDIAFVLDASGSILPKQYKLQKEFVSKAAAANNISRGGIHVGVVLFSDSSTAPIKLSDYYTAPDFANGVNELKHECSITRIDKGLKTAYDKLLTKRYGARDGVPKVLFLITDGKQTRRYNFIEPRVASMPLKKDGVHITAIGIGSGANRGELEEITGNKESVYMIKYFNQLHKKEFFDNFNFNCQDDLARSADPVSRPSYAPAPIKFGPAAKYSVALSVENKRQNDVILKWNEDGIPKQREIANGTSADIALSLKKNFYPEPVSFSATDKKSGELIKLRDRDNLQVIPRKTKAVEEITIVPDSKDAYVLFDVVNNLKEPIIVEWQQDGEKKSLRVLASSTESKEIKLDRGKPGALGPIPFKAFGEISRSPVSLNDQVILPIQPSVSRNRRSILAKPKLPDPFVNLKVVNERQDDIKLSWKEGRIEKFIRVPRLASRQEKITFPSKLGVDSASFTGSTFGKEEETIVKLNGKEVIDVALTLDDESVFSLKAKPKPKKIIFEAMNLASGPIQVLWSENGAEKVLDVAQGENLRRVVQNLGKDASKAIFFSARNKITSSPVLLNGLKSVRLAPSVGDEVQALLATDLPAISKITAPKDTRYVVVDINNLASDIVTVSWLEDGAEKSVEVGKGQRVQKTIVVEGKDALTPIDFSAVNKKARAPVLLNGAGNVLLTPTTDKKAQKLVALDHPDFMDVGAKKYVVVEIKNLASSNVTVSWLQAGGEKSIDVMKGNNAQTSIVLDGKDAQFPVIFSAKNNLLNAPALLNGVVSVQLTPSADKKVQQIVVTDHPDFKDGGETRYIVADIKNSASNTVTISWLEDDGEKTLDVEKGQTVQKTITVEGKNAAVPIMFSAINKVGIVPALINGAQIVELTPTVNKKAQRLIVLDHPDFGEFTGSGVKEIKYVVAQIQNLASGSVSVFWLEKGVRKTVDVESGKVIQKIIITDGKDASKPITFTGINKDSNRPVKLNDKLNVQLSPTSKETAQEIIIADQEEVKKTPQITVNLKNGASEPIIVSWKENGVDKTFDLEIGENIQQTIKSNDNKPITFTAKGKTSNAPVMLNGENKIDFVPSYDKSIKQAIATDVPKVIVANFQNGASEPIVVSWKENGIDKTFDLEIGENIQQTIKSNDDKPITFTAKGKTSSAPVMLNGDNKVDFVPSYDRSIKQAIATDVPRVIVANFQNGASEPIVVSWKENGIDKTFDLEIGENIQQTIKSNDDKPITFTAKGKTSSAPVMLNGDNKVDFVPSYDKSIKQAIATDVPRVIVANFQNGASEPIVVSWKENGIDKTFDLEIGENIQQTIKSNDDKPITFTAKGKTSSAPVMLNGDNKVDFVPSYDKSIKQAIATDVPRVIVANFQNGASEPIVVSWKENGIDKTFDLEIGENIQQTIKSNDDKPITFTAKGKTSSAPVMLNGDNKVDFVPSYDRSIKQAIATDVPRVIVANFQNGASEPIVVSWKENGIDKTFDLEIGENIQQTIKSNDDKPITFTAKGKTSSAPVMLNGDNKVDFVPSYDKSIKQAIATDVPRVIVANFQNGASEPIVVSWKENGIDKTFDLEIGENIQQTIKSNDDKRITFTAKGKTSSAPVMLNGDNKVDFVPSYDKSIKQAIATDVPRVIVANFQNGASEPIVVSWKENGIDKTFDLEIGENIQQTIKSNDDKPITFTAKGKTSSAPVMLNGENKVDFVPSYDRSIKQAIASDVPRVIVANFQNGASEPIVVSWKENGIDKTFDLEIGENIQQTIKSNDDKPITFTAKGKTSSAPVMLNGENKVDFVPSYDRSIKQAIASDVPRVIVANFQNGASEPIVVSWKENGIDKTFDLEIGENIQQTIKSNDDKPITFTAKGKTSSAPVMLNGENKVDFVPSYDKSIKQAIAADVPRVIVANFQNGASEPIVVSWKENGIDKTFDLEIGENIQQTIKSNDDNPITFSARGKTSNTPVMLNGENKVDFVPSYDRSIKQAIASDVPRVIVANFQNGASEPIVVSWKENGMDKTFDLEIGENIQQTIKSNDDNPITFTARGKTSNTPVMLNGENKVDFVPSYDRSIKQAIATNVPRVIVANFQNGASEPIVVSWKENGVDKTFDLEIGENIQQTIKSNDDKPITFTAKGKTSSAPVMLNGDNKVDFVPSYDKSIKQAIAADVPRVIVANFQNGASEPIVVSWKENGIDKTFDLEIGENIQQTIKSNDDKPITFTAKGKTSSAPVMLNGENKVDFVPSYDRSIKQAIATNVPRVIVANFQNGASEPIVVSWKENGIDKTFDLEIGENIQQTIKSNDDNPITFTAKGKTSSAPVMLNGENKVDFVPSYDSSIKQAVATDMPKARSQAIFANFENQASDSIVISWAEKGDVQNLEIAKGGKIRKEIILEGKDSLSPVIFTAKLKSSNAPVTLNGKEKLSITPSLNPTLNNILASSRYMTVNFISKVSRPTVIQWEEFGKVSEFVLGRNAKEKRVVHFNNAGGVVRLSGFFRRSGRKFPVILNRYKTLKLKEDPKRSVIQVTVEKRAMKKRKLRYLALNIQNKVNKPVSLKFEMQGREARFFIPALSKDRRLLKTYGDYAVPFTAKSIGDGRELYINKMDRLLLTPTDDIQWRKIVIKSEKPSRSIKYCATVTIFNRVAERVLLGWRIGNSVKTWQPEPDSVLRKITCAPGLNPMSPITFTSVTKSRRDPLFINGRIEAVAVPNPFSTNMKLYISKDQKTLVDLKATNKLPNDVILKWWYGSGMQKLVIPAKNEIGKILSLPNDLKGVEFRAFDAKTGSQPNVNGRKSVMFNPQQLTEKGIEVTIDSMYFLGYDIINNSPNPAIVTYETNNQKKELNIQPGARLKDMMTVYSNGLRKRVVFTAAEQDSGRQLTLNNRPSVKARPALKKRYKLMRIDRNNNPGLYYVILLVKNRISEDAVISWTQNGTKRSKECPKGSSSCMIAFAVNSEAKPVPVTFNAQSKQTGVALKLNAKSSLTLQPLPYKKLQRAVIEFEDVQNLICLFVSGYGSNMNPYPVVIKYVLNGKPESMRLDPYEKRLNELHIKNPNKTQPTLEFQAFDEKTQQPLRINGRASMLFKPNKYRSKVFLMVGKPLVAQDNTFGALRDTEQDHECKNKRVDVLFILDSSGTMTDSFTVAKTFARKLIGLFHLSLEGTHASVISLAGRVGTSLDINFSDYYNQTLFNNALSNLEFRGGNTRIDLALKIAEKQAFLPENGGRPGVPKLVFFISDGQQEPKKINRRYVNLLKEARPLHGIAKHVVSVGILGERPVDVGALQMITRSRKNVFNPGNMDTVVSDTFIKHIFNKYCNV